MVAGVTADGLEASPRKDSFTFGKIAANSSDIVFGVTDTVQAWVNGTPNHGWVFINTGPIPRAVRGANTPREYPSRRAFMKLVIHP